MYMYAYKIIYIYTYTYICMYLHTYIHIHIYIYTSTFIRQTSAAVQSGSHWRLLGGWAASDDGWAADSHQWPFGWRPAAAAASLSGACRPRPSAALGYMAPAPLRWDRAIPVIDEGPYSVIACQVRASESDFGKFCRKNKTICPTLQVAY